MSGGVDSSVAAYLLTRQGYAVTGVFMHTANLDGCAERDAEDARRAAEKIGCPFYVWDFTREYERKVVDYMVDGYRNGLTPNPDIMCNREIKFGLFLKRARQAGADFIATGHYVRLKKTGGECRLFRAKDRNKDQSYFLWTLGQSELSRCLFPIGGLIKPRVRQIARRAGLANAGKKDSQGICFLGKIKLIDFLRRYIPEKKGPVIDQRGEKIGEHRGIWFYTIGQRHFDFVPRGRRDGSDRAPYYVVGKDAKTNALIVAEGEDNLALFREGIGLREINFIRPVEKRKNGFSVFCRLRYRQPLFRGRLELAEENKGRLVFGQRQKFAAEGQSAVFYNFRGELLGGGIIQADRFF